MEEFIANNPKLFGAAVALCVQIAMFLIAKFDKSDTFSKILQKIVEISKTQK